TSSIAIQAVTSTFRTIGWITKQGGVFKRNVKQHMMCPTEITEQKVYVLKAYSGIEPDLLEAIQHLQPKGLIIEGFGQGNLPNTLTPVIQKYIKQDIPVVLTSICHHVMVQPTYDYNCVGRSFK